MRRVLTTFFVALLAGCGSSSEAPPAAHDSGADSSSTVAPDTGSDSGDEAATPIDSGNDVDDANDSGVDAMEASPCADAGPATLPFGNSAPSTLSQTGLYTDIASKNVAAGIKVFKPTNELWSDGAVKTRWVALPPCGKIDTTDMDHWSLPVGTRFFKEFVVDGKRIETRMIARFGPGPNDFIFAPYAWRDDESEADLVTNGVINWRGTPHDIPSVSDCTYCHGFLPEHALGFSAIQLSHPSDGVTLAIDDLVAEGAFTTNPPPGGYPVPGNAVESAAIGYLHANCSHCHNPDGIPFSNVYDLHLRVTQRTVESTSVYLTAVGKKTDESLGNGIVNRVTPGDPDSSCIFVRMSHRNDGIQMPPLATEMTDEAGIAKIKAWIQSIPASH